MDRQRLDYLLEQYRHNRCTPEELAEFEEWYAGLDDPSIPEMYTQGSPEAQAYVNVQYERFQKRKRRGRRAVVLSIWLKVAVALVIVAAGIVYFLVQKKYSHVSEPPAVVSYDVKADQATNSRYVLLPDSSIVILHAGSRITIDTTNFNVTTRSVTLTGEAYFDVKHNPAKPFIVQAGKAKITVLGTAFSINATTGQVSVTVTRGKVRVEEGKLVNILTQNQQIIYHAGEVSKPVTVKAEEQVQWIKAGLSFTNERLDTLASKLQARYHIFIKLGSDAIGKCRISAGNPFNGTESAEEILSLICPAINASFKKEGDVIIIDGPGCDNE